jgi:hypothetical protein
VFGNRFQLAGGVRVVALRCKPRARCANTRTWQGAPVDQFPAVIPEPQERVGERNLRFAVVAGEELGPSLRWLKIHPKAQQFLVTKGTFQQLSGDNALYAQALIAGGDLSLWHSKSDWLAKETPSFKEAARIANAMVSDHRSLDRTFSKCLRRDSGPRRRRAELQDQHIGPLPPDFPPSRF